MIPVRIYPQRNNRAADPRIREALLLECIWGRHRASLEEVLREARKRFEAEEDVKHVAERLHLRRINCSNDGGI